LAETFLSEDVGEDDAVLRWVTELFTLLDTKIGAIEFRALEPASFYVKLLG
jgi:hypothetical protein